MVFTDVSVSVPGLCKCLSTVGTGVRSLPCVYPHVNIQFVFANEALAAAGAYKRFISCVIALVHLQLRHATISPAALRTLVAGPHLHVLPAMQAQPAGRPETLAALCTLVGFLSSVDVDVQPEAGSRGEAVAADGAEVRSLSRMDGQVLLKLVLVQESLSADRARLWPLSLV